MSIDLGYFDSSERSRRDALLATVDEVIE
jgi:hypothetical protein